MDKNPVLAGLQVVVLHFDKPTWVACFEASALVESKKAEKVL